MGWPPPIADLLEQQAGVVARAQLREGGVSDNDVRRHLRRRDLVPLHPGIYLTHSGAPTWIERAWAACLVGGPAALWGDSALRAWDGPGRRDRVDTDPIDVAIDRQRARVDVPPGVRLHRIADLEGKALLNLSPPRLRPEQAALDLAADAASRGDELGAVQQLADAVQSRRTTADRLLATLRSRRRIVRRAFLREVLTDVAEGTCSVLEHGYLTRVERAHGLPVAERQRPGGLARPSYSDVAYPAQRCRVELDGRLFHDTAAARDADLERDLEAAVEVGEITVRLGWGQVFDRPCSTAARIVALLRSRGWAGTPRRCPDCDRQRGVLLSPDDSRTPHSA